MKVKFDLEDRNDNSINIGDKIVFKMDPDYKGPNDSIRIRGTVVFECGALGIGTNDNIPYKLHACRNDNFVSFWELYNGMEDLAEFEDLGYYLEVIKDSCTECPFNSKCENQDKCKE